MTIIITAGILSVICAACAITGLGLALYNFFWGKK
jgi:hypothetical protein